MQVSAQLGTVQQREQQQLQQQPQQGAVAAVLRVRSRLVLGSSSTPKPVLLCGAAKGRCGRGSAAASLHSQIMITDE